MSVPVNQRSHGKLEAYVKAYELAGYTLKITKNKKVFSDDYRECLTDRIVLAAVEIYLAVGTANDKQVRSANDRKEYERRIALQGKAIEQCGELIKLIVLAKSVFHLSSKRVKYWTGLARETRSLIGAWGDSDIRRFSPLFDEKGCG